MERNQHVMTWNVMTWNDMTCAVNLLVEFRCTCKYMLVLKHLQIKKHVGLSEGGGGSEGEHAAVKCQMSNVKRQKVKSQKSKVKSQKSEVKSQCQCRSEDTKQTEAEKLRSSTSVRLKYTPLPSSNFSGGVSGSLENC